MVRNDGLQVGLIELYSMSCVVCVQLWTVIIKIGQLTIKSAHTENGQLCLQRYFYTGSSWEKRRSCHWSEEVSRGPEVISVYGKVLSKTQRICQRMSTSQVQRCYTHFCIHWPLKIVTCPNWHAAAKGYYISNHNAKNQYPVTLNFWKLTSSKKCKCQNNKNSYTM